MEEITFWYIQACTLYICIYFLIQFWTSMLAYYLSPSTLFYFLFQHCFLYIWHVSVAFGLSPQIGSNYLRNDCRHMSQQTQLCPIICLENFPLICFNLIPHGKWHTAYKMYLTHKQHIYGGPWLSEIQTSKFLCNDWHALIYYLQWMSLILWTITYFLIFPFHTWT